MNGQQTPMRTVIVDDAPEIRDVLRLALERQDDFEVVAEAADGQEAVAVVAEHQPHLVLLDIGMPVMDGLQAIAPIREESPGTIIVMLTGFAETVGALAAVEQGAHGYIRKGGGVDELMSQIREVLAYRFQMPGRRRGAGVGRPETPEV